MKQIIDFKTTLTSTYDLILTNSDADIIHAERDLKFTENFSNHCAVVFELAFCTQVSKMKQLVFYSYCRCDFDSLNKSIALDPFNPICYSNQDVHVAAWYDWFFDLISQHTPRRTIKRQNTQQWITPRTVHFIYKLSTYRKSLNKRYLKKDVQKKKLEDMTKHCEDLQKDNGEL